MKNNIVTATEANRTFSNILNKVHYQGQIFEIKRGKEIIAKIIPIEQEVLKLSIAVNDLNDFFKKLPSLEPEDAEKFEEEINEIRELMKPRDDLWG